MRNETRVGVVVGLLVVVVTSVYFYGSSREDEDVLVGLNRRSTSMTPGPLMTGASNPSAALPPPVVKPVVEPLRSTPAPTPAGTPPLFATNTPRETAPVVPKPVEPPQPDETFLADATRSRRGELPPLSPSPLPLRSGASDLLDEATRKNLEPEDVADDNVRAPTGLDLDAISDRIRGNGAISNDGPVANEPPTVNSAIQPPMTNEIDSGRVLANAPPASPAGWPKQHRVEYGETLYGISVQYYGRSSGTNAILKANPSVKSPKGLREGQTLVIPALDVQPTAVAAAPTMPAGRTAYVVRDGDSFYTIARRVLNDGKRWEEIYEMNKALVKNSPKRLRPGMTIQVPVRR